MTLGQRCLLVWMLGALALCFIVIYLDGGLDREPLPFTVFLLVLDAVSLASIWFRVDGYAQYRIAFVRRMPHLSRFECFAYSVPLLMKMAFEVLLCVRLRYPLLSLSLMTVIAPLMGFLAFFVVIVFMEIISQSNYTT